MADYPKDVELKDGDDIIAVKEMEKMFQSAKRHVNTLLVGGDVTKNCIKVKC